MVVGWLEKPIAIFSRFLCIFAFAPQNTELRSFFLAIWAGPNDMGNIKSYGLINQTGSLIFGNLTTGLFEDLIRFS